ncbi:isoflavone reductase family protein [Nemania sp. FL0916]|nr:isoflavone reductase family protein [Nemania sp. FL0916]
MSMTFPFAIQNVIVIGAGGLLGTEICAALLKDHLFSVFILSRKSSKSTFPSDAYVHKIDDAYPFDQLVEAFRGKDAVVSAIPGRPYAIHLRMIDAAIQAGVTRFIPSEYGNNTCGAAAELVSLYSDKAKVMAHLRSKERAGLTWTAIHTGQFFDWGLETGWLDYNLEKSHAIIYDSGNKKWSTTTIGTVAAAVVGALLKPEDTMNTPLFVASFTVSQVQVLRALEKATGKKWTITNLTSEETLEKADTLDGKDDAQALKLRILMLMYGEDDDRGADFEKDGLLANDMLDLPVEDLNDVVERVVKRKASS